MSDRTKNTKAEVTIGGWWCNALSIVFIYLKLTHHIDWSWLWVLSPLWIPWVLVVAFCFMWVLFNLFSKK